MVTRDKITIASEYFNKAYQLHTEGKIDEAIKNYKLSIEIFPTAKAHTFLGWAYSLRGRFEDAIGECEVAIDLDPDFGNPYNDIGSYLISLNKFDEAITWLEKAIEIEGYEMKHHAYYNLGKIYEKKGDWETAMRYYEDSYSLKRDFDLAKSALIRITAMMN